MNEFQEYLEKTEEIGKIVKVSNFLLEVSGLPSLKINEMIITESGAKGIAFSLEKEIVKILSFEEKLLKPGEFVVRTGETFKIPVSDGLLGRILTPLLQPIDDLEPVFGEKKYLEIYREVPGIIQRKRVKRPLETGIAIVDFLVPIGHGQRELVIGDPKTGKTTFLLQTMVNQAKEGTVCIYVGIGKEISAIKFVEEYLKEKNVFEKVIMIVSFGRDSPVLNYFAPFSGMTVAEYFRDKGKNTILILDDLTSHAKFYREISLLAKKIPGRSCYPGDVFHIQAQLLERAGNVKNEFGEVSITALPVAETLENDISGYIQTNLMAMTDGHIFFDSDEFKKGKRPAINPFLSVSRVGNQTKTKIEREMADLIRKSLIEYQKALTVVQFGVELSPKTKKILENGRKIEILFDQDPETLIPYSLRIFLFGLLFFGFFDGKPNDLVKLEKQEIIKNYYQGKLKEIEEIKMMESLKELNFFIEIILPKIRKLLQKF
jgi:F-type H+-transporting ATPase subunit alpha